MPDILSCAVKVLKFLDINADTRSARSWPWHRATTRFTTTPIIRCCSRPVLGGQQDVRQTGTYAQPNPHLRNQVREVTGYFGGRLPEGGRQVYSRNQQVLFRGCEPGSRVLFRYSPRSLRRADRQGFRPRNVEIESVGRGLRIRSVEIARFSQNLEKTMKTYRINNYLYEKQS